MGNYLKTVNVAATELFFFFSTILIKMLKGNISTGLSEEELTEKPEKEKLEKEVQEKKIR